MVLAIFPKDKDHYMCEYLKKVALLKDTSSPRIIFVGGSNVAFGIDSKRISESLNINVINFGLHAGIGIRFPMSELEAYIQPGDKIILQFEYSNFYNGGNGAPETFSNLMVSSNGHRFSSLNLSQISNMAGIPGVAMGRIVKWITKPLQGILDQFPGNQYQYTMSGFNEFGDEVKHKYYSSLPPIKPTFNKSKNINKRFIKWLSETVKSYEDREGKVYFLPPCCIQSYFSLAYNDEIEKVLADINHPYLVSPSYMTVPDTCMFDAVYHVNKYGIEQNTTKIISILDVQ